MKIDDIHAMYDQHTLLIMRMVLAPDSNCVDVGAHVGAILKDIVKLAPQGTHYAFEPIPDLLAGLKANDAFRAVQLHPHALSDEPGEATFYLVANDPAYSGLKQRRYDRPDPQIQEIRVERARLDDLVPPGQRIELIKIDVEGAEMPVMRGAERIIRECQPYIIFESGLGASDRYGTNGATLHQFLAGRCGLEINTLDGFLTGADGLTESELTTIFDATERYYFVAHAPLTDRQRRDHFRNYVLDVDTRLFALGGLHAKVAELEQQLAAQLPEIRIHNWGAQKTSVGRGVNVQPDGSSALWIEASHVSRAGATHVYFGQHRAHGPATVSDNLVTTSIPADVIQTPGDYPVVIVEASGRRATVGTFVVKR